MLLTRFLSILVLLPLVVSAIIFMPTNIIALVSLIFFIPCAIEWSKLIVCKKNILQVFFAFMIVMIGFCCWFFKVKTYYLILISLIWWFIALSTIFFYPKGKSIWKFIPVSFLVGCITIIPAWFAILYLHGNKSFGPKWLLYFCFIVWSADIGAYLFGKKWGKHRIAPNLSPGKTIEGVVGAFISVLLVTIIFKLILKVFFEVEYMKYSWFSIIIASLITTVFAIIGDLSESMFKRIRGIKDSGNLIPGHGGALDRLDSILAAAPVFVFCLAF